MTTMRELLYEDAVVPSFNLPSADGEKIKLWDYKGRRNLALYFLTTGRANGEEKLLSVASRNYAGYRAEETEILVILHAGVEDAARVKSELALPFPVLADAEGSIHNKYLPSGSTGLFLTDRYGGLYHQFLASVASELPEQSEILEWLKYLEAQCSY